MESHPDLIKSKSIGKRIEELGLDNKDKLFSMEDLDVTLVKALNEDFNGPNPASGPHFLLRTETYLTLQCKYTSCRFSLWFKEKDGRFYLERKVNQSHLIDSHRTGAIKKTFPVAQVADSAQLPAVQEEPEAQQQQDD